MATHSSILTWKIPWTEKPGRPQSMGSHSQTQLSVCVFGIGTEEHSRTHTLHGFTLLFD